MRAARLEMTGVAMQTQSIRQTFTDIYRAAHDAPGDFLVRLGAESPATAPDCSSRRSPRSSSRLGLSMQAVHARLVAMEQAEKIILEDMQTAARPRSRRRHWWHVRPAGRNSPTGFDGLHAHPAGGPTVAWARTWAQKSSPSMLATFQAVFSLGMHNAGPATFSLYNSAGHD